MQRVGNAGTPSVDAIVRDLYGSLSEDTSFRPCLRAVGPPFRAHITALHHEELLVRSSGLEMMGEVEGEEFQRMAGDYSERWLGKNLWIERGIGMLMTRGYGVGDENVGARELLESEYFRHFLRPVDIRHGLGINVQTDGVASLAILSVNRAECEGEFTPEELALVAELRPHLVNAYAICRRLATLSAEADGLRAGFDCNPLGMLVLDADGHVLEHNAEAARLLRTGPGLSCGAGGVLHFSQPSVHARYRAAVARLVDPQFPPQPATMVVSAGGASAPAGLALHLCPFPASSVPVRSRGGRLLAFLCELSPASEHKLAACVLRAAFGFTPMETEVVLMLHEHYDPAHAALQLGLAVSTVRSHLKHVFAKTGASGQGELMRLVDRLLGSLPR
jgi:DNA-binding CsgD family transcriptional regulator/PAS domain-containing protein